MASFHFNQLLIPATLKPFFTHINSPSFCCVLENIDWELVSLLKGSAIFVEKKTKIYAMYELQKRYLSKINFRLLSTEHCCWQLDEFLTSPIQTVYKLDSVSLYLCIFHKKFQQKVKGSQSCVTNHDRGVDIPRAALQKYVRSVLSPD